MRRVGFASKDTDLTSLFLPAALVFHEDRLTMPLERKVKLLEGLKIAVGARRAYECWARFHHMYADKHGTCLEFIQREETPDSFIRYTRREAEVARRYFMMYAHLHDGLTQTARYAR